MNIKESTVSELKRFCKTSFDADELFDRANELKYSSMIRKYFSEQLQEPSDDFVQFMILRAYEGRKTAAVIERFRPIVKSTLNGLIGEMMNDRITMALKNEAAQNLEPSVDAQVDDVVVSKIITTQNEIEAFGMIKTLLMEIISPERVTYKDTENYFSVLIDGKVTKWVCRLKLDGRKQTIQFQEGIEPKIVVLESVDRIYALKEAILASAQRVLR